MMSGNRRPWKPHPQRGQCMGLRYPDSLSEILHRRFFPLLFCEAVALVRQSRPIHVEVSLFHKLRYPRNFFDKNYNNVGAALYQAVVIYLHNMLIVWVNESLFLLCLFQCSNQATRQEIIYYETSFYCIFHCCYTYIKY